MRNPRNIGDYSAAVSARRIRPGASEGALGLLWTSVLAWICLVAGLGCDPGDSGAGSAFGDTVDAASTPDSAPDSAADTAAEAAVDTAADAAVDSAVQPDTEPGDVAVDGAQADADGAPDVSDAELDGKEWNPAPQPVTLVASDGLELYAEYRAPRRSSAAAVLLVHQFQNSLRQWDAVLDGWGEDVAVLAFDLRGHGLSQAQPGPFAELLTDPTQTPLDVRAAWEWLATQPEVDASRIAIIGTSIGANLTVVEGFFVNAAAVVPLSPRESSILSLASKDALSALPPTFCIAGELDGQGAQAATCEALIGVAADGSQSMVVEGSSAHGVAFVKPDGAPWQAMRAWLSGQVVGL